MLPIGARLCCRSCWRGISRVLGGQHPHAGARESMCASGIGMVGAINSGTSSSAGERTLLASGPVRALLQAPAPVSPDRAVRRIRSSCRIGVRGAPNSGMTHVCLAGPDRSPRDSTATDGLTVPNAETYGVQFEVRCAGSRFSPAIHRPCRSRRQQSLATGALSAAQLSSLPRSGISVEHSLRESTTVRHLVSVLLCPCADSGQVYRGVPGVPRAPGSRRAGRTRTPTTHPGASLDVWPQRLLKGFSVLDAEVDRVFGSLECEANFACIGGPVEIVADLNDCGLCHGGIVPPRFSNVQLRCGPACSADEAGSSVARSILHFGGRFVPRAVQAGRRTFPMVWTRWPGLDGAPNRGEGKARRRASGRRRGPSRLDSHGSR
jgi:hypothetical protein